MLGHRSCFPRASTYKTTVHGLELEKLSQAAICAFPNRNPDDDLPLDFEEKRASYYQALEQPEDAQRFIASIQQRMQEELELLNKTLPKNPHVRLRDQGKKRIVLSPLSAQPEPRHLVELKAELMRRWPMTRLLDVLKETDLRVGFTELFKSLASREHLDRSTLQRRLLRCLFGLGTNTGLKRVAAGDQDADYQDLRSCQPLKMGQSHRSDKPTKHSDPGNT